MRKKQIPIILPKNKVYTIPKIVKQFVSKGTRYYECSDGRIFVADIYDYNFKVTKSAIKPKNYRDKELGRTKQLKGL